MTDLRRVFTQNDIINTEKEQMKKSIAPNPGMTKTHDRKSFVMLSESAVAYLSL